VTSNQSEENILSSQNGRPQLHLNPLNNFNPTQPIDPKTVWQVPT